MKDINMRVAVSINPDVRDFLQGKDSKGEYSNTLDLVKEFNSRGHDVNLVFPNELTRSEEGVIAENKYGYEKGSIFSKDSRSPLDEDSFFVRSLSEDSPDVFFDFLDKLYDVENQVGFMVNNAESTSYEYKPKQKNLDLPFIPEYNPESKSELESILKKGSKLIAKPAVGFMGSGVEYLEGPSSAKAWDKNSLSQYCFEEFVPEMFERRYVFLEDQIVARRGMKTKGNPGTEYSEEKFALREYRPQDEEIVKDAINKTGMSYGCVDFRGPYVLEINGSGTTSSASDKSGNRVYSLGSDIVDLFEKNYLSGK